MKKLIILTSLLMSGCQATAHTTWKTTSSAYVEGDPVQETVKLGAKIEFRNN